MQMLETDPERTKIRERTMAAETVAHHVAWQQRLNLCCLRTNAYYDRLLRFLLIDTKYQ